MSKTKVLIVEDDQEIARLTTLYLEAEGYNVSVVHDGNLALEAIRNTEPDLVLLDLMLPGLSGAQICRQAREFYNGIILVLTASADEMSEVSLFKFGADDYVTKPIRGHALLARIEALLRRASPAVETMDISKLEQTGWQAPTPFIVKDRNGQHDIHGLMYKPSNFDANKTYPVVNYLYPGPQVGSIRGRHFREARGDNQAIAELGFIVIEIDALGTPGRSKSFHEFYYHQF